MYSSFVPLAQKYYIYKYSMLYGFLNNSVAATLLDLARMRKVAVQVIAVLRVLANENWLWRLRPLPHGE